MKDKTLVQCLFKETEEARWRDGTKKSQLKGNISSSGKWRVVERRRGGGRVGRREGGRDSEEFMLVWWGPGLEQRRGAERTLRTRLDDWSPSWVLAFLQRGKEMLMFTLTTSRLYNVNVKLHRRAQSHPPCLYTSFIYIFKNTALTRQTLPFLSVYTLQIVKKDRSAFKTSSDHGLKSKSNNFL